MKRSILFSTVLLTFVFIATNGFAATKNSLKFTDTYADKLVNCSKSLGCDVAGTGKYTVNATISLAGFNISDFNQDTSFGLQVGYLDVSAVLGDDSSYKAGKKTAKFYFYAQDDNGNNVQVTSAQLNWNSKQLTITIKGILTDFSQSIATMDYLYENTSAFDNIDGYISFSDANNSADIYFDVQVTGSAKVKTTNKYGDAYDISTINLKGTGTEIPAPSFD
jgi:hypothetical protein